jgi:hypothetical protein
MKFGSILALVVAAMLTTTFALVAAAGVPCTDQDSDGVCDEDDNCLVVANPDQSDGDSDGYGEACDLDTNNDCFITTADIGVILTALGASESEPPASPSDVNLDGFVSTADIGVILTELAGGANPPGPSGKSCAGCGGGEPTGQGAAGPCLGE